MDTIQTSMQSAMGSLKNPYVVGVIGILAVVYGSLIAPQLPPNVAAWFANPFFKLFFIFLILAVRDISPTVAILLALGLIISIQTVNRYRVFTMANEVSQITTPQKAQVVEKQNPNPEEIQQMKNEIAAAIEQQRAEQAHQNAKQNVQIHQTEQPRQHVEPSQHVQVNQAYQDVQGSQSGQMRQKGQPGQFHQSGQMRQSGQSMQVAELADGQVQLSVPDAGDKPVASLHPMNRPTDSTQIIKTRVENPDAPDHPGWKTLNGPNVDVSLYELNPPFLRKNLPNQFINPNGSVKSTDTPQIFPPQYEDKLLPHMAPPPRRGASRYSAYHGYPVVPETVPAINGQPVDIKATRMMRDINDNMASQVVEPINHQLPNSMLGDNQLLPNRQNLQYDVAAKLNPRNDAYIGGQGISFQSGYPGRRQGAEYANQRSEL